jgi:glutaredoxin
MQPRKQADALLLISSTCPHCAAVADAMMRLVKSGRIARLEIVNLDQRPEQAQRLGVRSVPWLRLGPFELTGALGYAELEQWAEHAAAGTGFDDYAAYQLEHRQLDRVVERVRNDPRQLQQLLDLLADDETSMGVRIGIGAVVEELAGGETLRQAVPLLEQLTLSALPQTRADACHYLGLAGDRNAVASVRRLLDDEQEDVREIAAETLTLLDPAATS